MIGCEEDRYEAREVGMGTVNGWPPPRVERGRGERRVFVGPAAVHACGAEHAGAVPWGSDGGRSGDEAARRPWRHAGDRGDWGLPC